jgi:hypothetical protein
LERESQLRDSEADQVRVPPPMFLTVRVREVREVPKSREEGERERMGPEDKTVTFTVPSAYFVGSEEQEAFTFRVTVWLLPVVLAGAVQVGFGALGLEKEPLPMGEE